MLGSYVRELQRVALTYGGIAFAGGSIVSVFLIMWWHLNSLFLACVSMVEIMLGFPFAFAIYRYMFMVTFFDTLNTLVIFLILGIGADDGLCSAHVCRCGSVCTLRTVFVFVDAWVQVTCAACWRCVTLVNIVDSDDTERAFRSQARSRREAVVGPTHGFCVQSCVHLTLCCNDFCVQHMLCAARCQSDDRDHGDDVLCIHGHCLFAQFGSLILRQDM